MPKGEAFSFLFCSQKLLLAALPAPHIGADLPYVPEQPQPHGQRLPVQGHSHVLLHLCSCEGLQHHLLVAGQAPDGLQGLLCALKQHCPPCVTTQEVLADRCLDHWHSRLNKLLDNPVSRWDWFGRLFSTVLASTQQTQERSFQRLCPAQATAFCLA